MRGAGRSKPAEQVLGEVRRRVEQGHREVVLSGINLGCFHDSGAGLSLAGLLAALFLAVEPVHVRYSHVAVTDVPATAFSLLALVLLVGAAQGRGRPLPVIGGFLQPDR